MSPRPTHRPIRTCVGCGGRDAPGSMLRLKRTSGGGLVVGSRFDTGRSAYVHDEAGCLNRLGKSRLLARSLRCRVGADERAALLATRSAAPSR